MLFNYFQTCLNIISIFYDILGVFLCILYAYLSFLLNSRSLHVFIFDGQYETRFFFIPLVVFVNVYVF